MDFQSLNNQSLNRVSNSLNFVTHLAEEHVEIALVHFVDQTFQTFDCLHLLSDQTLHLLELGQLLVRLGLLAIHGESREFTVAVSPEAVLGQFCIQPIGWPWIEGDGLTKVNRGGESRKVNRGGDESVAMDRGR